MVNGQWSMVNSRLFMIPTLHCIVLHFVTASYSLLPHKKDQDQDQDQDQVHLHPPGETCNSSTRKNKDRTFLSIRQIYLFQLQRPKAKIQNPKAKPTCSLPLWLPTWPAVLQLDEAIMLPLFLKLLNLIRTRQVFAFPSSFPFPFPFPFAFVHQKVE